MKLQRRIYRLLGLGKRKGNPEKSLLQRIYRLLQADERKRGIKVACAVCFAALLDFAGLAALLPSCSFCLAMTVTAGAKRCSFAWALSCLSL